MVAYQKFNVFFAISGNLLYQTKLIGALNFGNVIFMTLLTDDKVIL